MAMNGPKLLSGRVPVTPYSKLSNDRYQFLGLSDAEPNLGSGSANSILTLSTGNTRVWSNAIILTSISVSGTSNLGNVSNIYIGGGTNGAVLSTDGSGNLSWSTTPNVTQIKNVNSNVSIPSSNGNININANNGTNQQWVFDNSGNLTLPGNLNLSNASQIQFGNSIIAVSGSNVGIFTTSVTNVNLGLESNVTMGSNTGNVTSRGIFNAANIVTTGTIAAQNIRVGDLYSNRSPVAVSTETVIDSFNSAEYRSAKYTIRASNDLGYQALEVLLIHNSINSIMTVYGNLSTTGSDIITLSTSINVGVVELLATGIAANTSVNLLGTYVPD